MKPVKVKTIITTKKKKKRFTSFICPVCGNDLDWRKRRCRFCNAEIDWKKK